MDTVHLFLAFGGLLNFAGDLCSPGNPGEQIDIPEHFFFYGESGAIDWAALNDRVNWPILNACLWGTTKRELEALGIADLDVRLAALERGQLLRRSELEYRLAFPSVVGEKRSRIQGIVQQAAQQLLPTAEKLIEDTLVQLEGRERVLYHVLWSVVMDGREAWSAAETEMRKRVKCRDTSIQNKAWLIYPSHSFSVGTNTYSTRSSNQLIITWSRTTTVANRVRRVIVENEGYLIGSAAGAVPVGEKAAMEDLVRYGLVDEAGRCQMYVFWANSEAGTLYANLGQRFGNEVMAHLDAEALADVLEAPVGTAFLLVYHEICWELLKVLADRGVLDIPSITFSRGSDLREEGRLVSLRITV